MQIKTKLFLLIVEIALILLLQSLVDKVRNNLSA